LYPITKPRPQTRVTEDLRMGAAGASGTVIEPLAITEKFPLPTLHVHYARGCTMAESFYQAVEGPFQLLIVGDPLCRPWADIPEVSVTGLEGDFLSGEIEITPTAKTAAGKGVDHFELFVDGVRRQSRTPGQSFVWDTKKVVDGYHELRIVAVDNTPIETQGRWIGGVTVKNGRDAVEIIPVDGPRVTGAELILNVASTIDGPTVVFHNERPVGRVTGRQARLQVATDRLGKGQVVLQARTVGKSPVHSRPLRLEIL
jgi:hypothetical protein